MIAAEHKPSGPFVWLLILAILLAGGAAAWAIVYSAPKPQRVKPPVQARLVDVAPLTQEASRPYWLTGGAAMAADSVSLAAQVAGRVAWVNPQAVPGAALARGTVLARLESADFEVQVAQAEAALVQARSELAIEKGQSKLAEEEYAIAASRLSDEERALVLRKPQLAAAQAAVSVAEANLRQARLEQARSELKMPFDGRISQRAVSVGSYITASTAAFELVGTERVWIEVKVPRNFLPWLDASAMATLSVAQGERQARILNVLPDVADADRQARVMLELADPMAAGQTPVLVNDYVDVRLPGRSIAATVIESRLLNDDGSVWVVNDSKLYRRQPEVIFRGREKVWLGSGLQDGDQLLLNRIDSVTEGLLVRTRGSADSEAANSEAAANEAAGSKASGSGAES
ncbi:efflux RND transporter periplasmic adaptor subunit [Thalassolituus sp. LLYu03]|uniref:efflux RND transporter periplasmic adaptor subunit n=1 Tax=Thalassolituus sp. LLYu03 TaxID=3421656 RepID=UPI003D289787